MVKEKQSPTPILHLLHCFLVTNFCSTLLTLQHQSVVRVFSDYFSRFNYNSFTLPTIRSKTFALIFIKHYWSPKLSELRDGVFKTPIDLEQSINN